MALADILKRIEEDADEEAFCIVDEAKTKAEWHVEQARGRAEQAREEILESARQRAERERETMLANARLQARDRAVAARHELVGRVLRLAEETLVALPDEAYAALLAAEIVSVARGGESVRVAGAERERLSGRLPDAVARAAEEAGRSVGLDFDSREAEIPFGVVLSGDRTSVEISARALVRERVEEIQALAAKELFGEDSGSGGDERSESVAGESEEYA